MDRMIILSNRKKEKKSFTKDITTNTKIILKNSNLKSNYKVFKNSYVAFYYEMHRALIHQGQISTSLEMKWKCIFFNK